MTENPLYNLTWGEYGTSLVSAVQFLRCHGELVDVTLAAGGKTFSAHKVVLCAASPFLLDLLKSTTCKHPIVMLAGVHASDLEALLEFIYRGEVSIEQTQLPSLIQAAHCLNIQGLASLNLDQFPEQSGVNVKQVLDISKSSSEEHIQETSCQQDEEVHNKRKKKVRKITKNSSPTSPVVKWPKVYVHLDNVIPGSNEQQEGSSQNWGTHHMNLVNASSTNTTESVQTPILIQSSTQYQNSSSSTKVKGASDQPGTCPLCGAMLRQARNLRRHLLTSCKYRMIGTNPTNLTAIEQTRAEENHLHNNIQTISAQNLGRINPNNTENLDDKQNLTPITCSEMLTPTSNIINITSNNL